MEATLYQNKIHNQHADIPYLWTKASQKTLKIPSPFIHILHIFLWQGYSRGILPDKTSPLGHTHDPHTRGPGKSGEENRPQNLGEQTQVLC